MSSPPTPDRCGVRWLAVALAAAALGCGDSPPPDPATPEPAAQATTKPVPSAAPTTAPTPSGPADAQAGAVLYGQYCSSCHGVRGDGDGPVAAGLDPAPARHSDGEVMNALSDDYLFRVIEGGGPAVGKSPLMAAWGGTLRDVEILDVVAFIRTLADPPPPGSPGS